MSKIVTGKSPPSIEISAKGEAVLQNGHINYTAWSIKRTAGKIRTILHMAGRSTAKEINMDLVDALREAKFPHNRYNTTTVVNLKDSIFGTGPIVNMTLEANKKKFPWASFVLDTKGEIQKAWNLDKESSAVVVIDDFDKVLFFKDGKLTSNEVKSVVTLIENELSTVES